MATLTKSTGTVTLTGAAEKVTLPAVYGWVWLKNMSDSDIFAGLSADISEGADGVMTIPAGECGRLQTDGFDSVYLMGTGNALVVAQNYADCPFKVGVKGGEIPDLSAYAKKSDIPTELPANGGNADTVDGLHASDFVRAFNGTEMTSNRVLIPNDVHVGNWLVANAKVGMCYYISSDNKGLTGLPDGDVGWAWFVYNGVEYFAKTIDDRLFYMNYINSYSGWSEIYTSKSKPYVTGTLSEQASGTNVTMSFTIFNFTPSKVLCQFGSGNAFFANVVTNGFSVTIPAGTTTIHYIAFK